MDYWMADRVPKYPFRTGCIEGLPAGQIADQFRIEADREGHNR